MILNSLGAEFCGGLSLLNVTSGQPVSLRIKLEEDTVHFPYGRTCAWQVAASTGHRIRVTIQDLVTSPNNYLEFGHIRGTEFQSLLHTQANDYSPLYVISEANSLWIIFNANAAFDDSFAVEIQQFQPVGKV